MRVSKPGELDPERGGIRGGGDVGACWGPSFRVSISTTCLRRPVRVYLHLTKSGYLLEEWGFVV